MRVTAFSSPRYRISPDDPLLVEIWDGKAWRLDSILASSEAAVSHVARRKKDGNDIEGLTPEMLAMAAETLRTQARQTRHDIALLEELALANAPALGCFEFDAFLTHLKGSHRSLQLDAASTLALADSTTSTLIGADDRARVFLGGGKAREAETGKAGQCDADLQAARMAHATSATTNTRCGGHEPGSGPFTIASVPHDRPVLVWHRHAWLPARWRGGDATGPGTLTMLVVDEDTGEWKPGSETFWPFYPKWWIEMPPAPPLLGHRTA